VRDNGDIYINLRSRTQGGGVVGLRDSNQDAIIDETVYFSDIEGTGIDIYQDYLYVASDTAVYRFALSDTELMPAGEAETVVSDFPVQRSHASKSFAFDEQGHLYVNVGAPSNACQERARTAGSPGQRPCPELEQSGGIWQFAADQLDQHWSDGKRFATGLRNCVALAWDSGSQQLYVAMHGRDQLNTLWPAHFTVADNARLPAEEFHRLQANGHYGWPYTYYDPQAKARMVAPEYGGDGKQSAENALYAEPLAALPAHWGPNDLVFYHSSQFPKRYHGGAFIAFHGSWNRAPKPQQGFNVVFIPFADGEPVQGWEVFADGFTGKAEISSPGQAEHRPTGVAVGPEGALYVVDSVRGTLWRISAE
jgi:glucose/arabinose dehydrogenase